MYMAALRRLIKEYSELEDNENYKAEPVDGNNFLWRATLFGPAQSKIEGKEFDLELQFPNEYPYKPPKVRFLTSISNQHVSKEGKLCLDILDTAWSPALTIDRVLLSILSVLTDSHVFRERLRRRAD
jgi:ubiquitin-conjugating enzyme E2 D/E